MNSGNGLNWAWVQKGAFLGRRTSPKASMFESADFHYGGPRDRIMAIWPASQVLGVIVLWLGLVDGAQVECVCTYCTWVNNETTITKGLIMSHVEIIPAVSLLLFSWNHACISVWCHIHLSELGGLMFEISSLELGEEHILKWGWCEVLKVSHVEVILFVCFFRSPQYQGGSSSV